MIKSLPSKLIRCHHRWVFNCRPFLWDGGMTKKVELRCTECGKIVYKDLFSKLPKKAKGTYIFCPTCQNELLHKPECLIQHINGVSTLKCNDCGCETDWDMENPVPIRVPRVYTPPEYLKKHTKDYVGEVVE